MKGNRPSRGFGRTLGAFALGATAGSIIALLYAPASGQMTRRRIGMRVRAWEHATARQLQQARRVVGRRARLLREAAVEKVDTIREGLLERVSNGNGRHPVHRAAR